MTAAALTADSPLTAEQRAALDARSHSVSLAAGAGCGKTYVLTERFLAEVDPTSFDEAAGLSELVAITFTEAAAREMRDRIRRRAFARLQSAADDAEAAAWQRLLRSIDGARISTIHSFATALLRRYAVEAGVDPQFTVLDAPAASLLRLEAVDDFLRRELIARNADALDLAAAGSLEKLRNDLARVSEAANREAILRWRDATVDEVLAAWRKHHESEAVPAALNRLVTHPALAALAAVCQSGIASSPRLRERMAAIGNALAGVLGLPGPTAANLAELRTQALVGNNFKKPDDWHNFEDRELFNDACKCLRDAIDKGAPKPLDPSACKTAAAEGLALTRLAAGIVDSIEEVKGSRAQLEFDDLLLKTHALLTDPRHDAIRREVAAATRLVMVDEFQDTNPLQLEIVQAVSGEDWKERGLFAVGDFKQSIYGFQGAEPTVSTKLRAELPAQSRLSLTTNFRSQPGVLAFVNAIFHGAFAEYEPLVRLRPQTTEGAIVEFLWTPAEPDDDTAFAGDQDDQSSPGEDASTPSTSKSAVDRRRREARRIARRLRQLLDSQAEIVVESVEGAPTPRPVRPGDIAILFRTLGDVQQYEEALRNAGLDYYLAGGHAFYAQQEVFDVLNLLRAIDSTVDEIALAGALRSPFFSLHDATLFWLVDRAGSLNSGLAMAELPSQIAGDERRKVERAAATLGRLRREKDRLLTADLVTLAFDLTGYDAVVQTEFLGARKAANLAKLREQARALDQTSPGDLHGFVTQLAEFVTRAPNEPPAAAQAEGDVIRLMTIHNAKGLEFPVVVLPDLERKRPPDAREPVIDANLGPLVPHGEDKKVKGTCVGHDFYREAESAKDDEERTRLFYVACTRAADYLILSSSIENLDQPKQDWLQLVARHVALADGTLAAPLPPDYDVPHVRVTLDEPASGDVDAGPHGPDLDRLVAKTRELAAKPRAIPAAVEPIAVDVMARRRFSFSRVSGHLAALKVDEALGTEEDDDASTPVRGFDGENRDGRARGALAHAILERLDWRQPGDLRVLARSLAADFFDDQPEDAAAEVAAMIERFLATPRARQLADARLLRPEVEFVLPWPPDDSSRERPAGRYIQGFMDLVYQDVAGLWRLIDYKTNRIAAANVAKTAAQYEPQMLCYTIAAEQALGVELAETTLVLLDLGLEHSFTWSADQRVTGIARLSAAMDKYALAAAEA